MTTLPDHGPPQSRASIRTDARLDSATRAKVDDLARQFGRPRAAVLCQIMHWGLSRKQTGPLDQGEAQGPVRHLHLSVDSALHARVEHAATGVGMKMAPWLRHMVRQITMTDSPASWHEARSEQRSHDSCIDDMRFRLRLDEPSQTKLQRLIEHVGASKAEIIRQLIAQAKPEDVPASWQMQARERRGSQAPSQISATDEKPAFSPSPARSP